MNSMRTIAVAICLLGTITGASHAQDSIPNSGFENWTAGEPDGWATLGTGGTPAVFQSADAHSGSSAARGEVVELFPGFAIPPTLYSGVDAEGFPVTQRWASLHGYYKLTSVGGDAIEILVTMRKGFIPVAVGAFSDSLPVTSYKEFVIDLFYGTEDVPDTADIVVTVFGGGTGRDWHAGTVFLLDDLSFSGIASSSCPVTLAGDANASGTIASSDIIYLVNYALKAGPEPLPCPAAGDMNCDGQVKASDIIYLVNYILRAGPAPCDVCALVPGTWSCP